MRGVFTLVSQLPGALSCSAAEGQESFKKAPGRPQLNTKPVQPDRHEPISVPDPRSANTAMRPKQPCMMARLL